METNHPIRLWVILQAFPIPHRYLCGMQSVCQLGYFSILLNLSRSRLSSVSNADRALFTSIKKKTHLMLTLF